MHKELNNPVYGAQNELTNEVPQNETLLSKVLLRGLRLDEFKIARHKKLDLGVIRAEGVHL